jgi:hypothetical protein
MSPVTAAAARALARRCVLELELAAVPAVIVQAPRLAGSVYLVSVKGGRGVLIEIRVPHMRRSRSQLRLERGFRARGFQTVTVRHVTDLERAFGLGPVN